MRHVSMQDCSFRICDLGYRNAAARSEFGRLDHLPLAAINELLGERMKGKQSRIECRALFFGLCWTLATYSPAIANVTISKKPTQNMSCSGGVCTPTAKLAVLNVKTLQQMLATSNVTINTGTGSLAEQVHNIIVAATMSWANSNTLTLDAYTSVEINKTVSVTGSGGLSITYNDGSTLGSFSVGPAGRVYFWDLNSALMVQGQPYTLVNNIATLASDVAANPSGHFALANGYNASSDGTYAQAAVPTALTGSFEGLGNQIYNLAINDARGHEAFYDGLFQEIGVGGEVSNLRLTQVNITGSGQLHTAGALAGLNQGTVSNVQSSGQVQFVSEDQSLVGGLVGQNKGLITDSWSSTSVTGDFAGGLTFWNQGGTITRSYATGAVSGRHEAGGLVGDNDGGTIQYSFASGGAQGLDNSDVGGLAALNEGIINQSFATGPASAGDAVVGGLVGENSGSGTITQSYAMGSASGGTNAYAGGLVGALLGSATIAQSYSTGAVSGGTGTLIGGSLGADFSAPGNIRVTYWDTDTSGISNKHQGAGNLQDDPGIKALTSSELQAGLPHGFSAKVWAQDLTINGGFPYLLKTLPQ
jgi:hypothetical protein